MAPAEGSILYEPKDIEDLAKFLKANKEKYHEIWVVLIKKEHANPQPVSFNEAVSTALRVGLLTAEPKL
ncbi:MAG: hypothetical protein ABSG33_04955 [Candidatus Bathyarchaeia archaeon]|jgi:hypothetical protein